MSAWDELHEMLRARARNATVADDGRKIIPMTLGEYVTCTMRNQAIRGEAWVNQDLADRGWPNALYDGVWIVPCLDSLYLNFAAIERVSIEHAQAIADEMRANMESWRNELEL